MNAVTYSRVSTAEAADLRLLRYLTVCRRDAQQEGFRVVAEFRDIGPGMMLDRPGLSAMRQMIARDSIQAVIVCTLSQLTRSTWHCASLRKEFARRGAELRAALRPRMN